MRDPDDRPHPLQEVLAAVVAEHLAEPGVQLGQAVVGGARLAGEQVGDRRPEARARGDEPRADGGGAVLGVLVPCLAPFGDLRLERLGLRVGGEVVLADPVLADDQGVARGHDLFLP